MLFNPRQILLAVAVAFVLSIFAGNFYSAYVPSLNGWKYYYTAVIPFKPSAYFVKIPLPKSSVFWSNINPDGSDLRVTVGDGSAEHEVPFRAYIDYNRHFGYIVAEVPRQANLPVHLYFGRPSAVDAQDPHIPLQSVRQYIPLYTSQFDVNVSPHASPALANVFTWAIDMCMSGAGRGGSVVEVRRAFYPPYVFRTYIQLPGWTRDTGVLIPLVDFNAPAVRDVNSMHLPRSYIYVYMDARRVPRADVVIDGHYYMHAVRLRSTSVGVLVTPAQITVGRHAIALDHIPEPVHLRIYGFCNNANLYIRSLYFQQDVQQIGLRWKGPFSAPQSPVISVQYPDIKAYPALHYVSFTVDLNVGKIADVNAYIEGPELNAPVSVVTAHPGSKEYSFKGPVDANLPDGNYTFVVAARADTNMQSTAKIPFTIDSVPPHVVAAYFYDANTSTLYLDVNASDATQLTCRLEGGKSPLPVSCSGLTTLSLKQGTYRLVVTDAAGNKTVADIRAEPPAAKVKTVEKYIPVPTKSTVANGGEPASVVAIRTPVYVYAGTAVVLAAIVVMLL